MKKLFTTLLFLIFCHELAEAGQEIIAVQSVRVAPYEEAIKGFESTCDANIKRFIISESEETDVVRKINKLRPDLVLAIGMEALLRVKRIKHTPIVYLMVHKLQSGLCEENITGISMNISQEQQLRTFLRVLPDFKRIGLLYDPDRTGHLVKKARAAAGKTGIRLIAKEIHNSREAPSLIMDMRGKIDAFWMLPDLTVIIPETVEFLLLFSIENKVPILTFSEKYAELGALMSLSIDPFDIGTQAGEMAKKILSGSDVKNVQRVDARQGVISINLKIARKLGITVDAKSIRGARVVN